MFDNSFYPTPASTIIDMLSGITMGDKKSILEPSAGKGDILDYIKGKYHSRVSLYAVEKILARIKGIFRDRMELS